MDGWDILLYFVVQQTGILDSIPDELFIIHNF